MTVRVDLHVHTSASYDCDEEPSKVVEAAHAAGLHVIAITDHDSTNAWAEAAEIGSRLGVHVVPGEEITTDAGHVLALFIREKVSPGSLKATVQSVREQGGLVIAAHPERYGNGLRKRTIMKCPDHFDGIEVFNGYNSAHGNASAASLAGRLHLPTSVGSDSHDARNLGHVYGEIGGSPEETTPETVRSQLLGGHIVAVGEHKGGCACFRCRVERFFESRIVRTPLYSNPWARTAIRYVHRRTLKRRVLGIDRF